ncbi:hypothetical protein Daus18300_005746 [Diaporthe australafricana]|uniref:RRM domain-containing protein n=1 Tax=Diaporthe australafricana TaxID=127596 RepID=A0ABR3WZH3_9PEZI
MSKAGFDGIAPSPPARAPSSEEFPPARASGDTIPFPLLSDSMAALDIDIDAITSDAVVGQHTDATDAPDAPTHQAQQMSAGATNATASQQAQQASTVSGSNDSEEQIRFAQWLEQCQLEQDNKRNRIVTISPLPDYVTVADVLPRIRGGIESCIISRFEETSVAVITFKRATDAITYTEFCAETPVWGLWTFPMSRLGVPFTWERRSKVALYTAAPGLGSSWKPTDIPVELRNVLPAGSRCLVLKGCKPHQVPGVYRGLGLHVSQHQKDQLEGMWLDGPVRGENGQVYGNLHVWYTSIKGAQEAKSRIPGLEFEFDPCSRSPEDLMLHYDETTKVPVFRHHEPFVNLLTLDEQTILRGASVGMVNVAQAYWLSRGPMMPASENTTSVAGRLQQSLQTNGGVQSYQYPTAASPGQLPLPIQSPNVFYPPSAGVPGPFLDHRHLAPSLQPAPFSTFPPQQPYHSNAPLDTFHLQQQFSHGAAPRASGGFGGFDGLTQRQPSNNGGGTMNTNTTSNNSNLGDSSSIPTTTVQHDASFISNSSSLSSVSACASDSTDATVHSSNGEDLGPEVCTDISSTGPDNTPERIESGLLDGKGATSDSPPSPNSSKAADRLIVSPAADPGKYSHKNMDDQDVFWTCSLEEFHAMSPQHWASFGTVFYTAPDGFDTAVKHLVKLE